MKKKLYAKEKGRGDWEGKTSSEWRKDQSRELQRSMASFSFSSVKRRRHQGGKERGKIWERPQFLSCFSTSFITVDDIIVKTLLDMSCADILPVCPSATDIYLISKSQNWSSTMHGNLWNLPSSFVKCQCNHFGLKLEPDKYKKRTYRSLFSQVLNSFTWVLQVTAAPFAQKIEIPLQPRLLPHTLHDQRCTSRENFQLPESGLYSNCR